MNFGELDDLIKLIKKESKSTFKNKKSYSRSNILEFITDILPKAKKKYKKTDYKLMDDLVNRFFNPSYKFRDTLCFDGGTNCFRDWDIITKNDEINTTRIVFPEKYKKLEAHFQRLFHTPQPEQRSAEWYKYRSMRITASDTATAIDLNPYEPVEHFIVKKVEPDRLPFKDGFFVYHGRKYEPPATQIYEHIYNNKVTEFGCLPSESYKILGASPDGICSKATLDNKFSERLGVMLEIKCPAVRKIKTSGKTAGVICPFYYYCQVQQQLECCDFEECDFWQCNIKEYKDREEFLTDKKHKCVLTEGNNSKEVPINPLITRGAIIELFPKVFVKRFDDDEQRFIAKYLYPPRLDLTLEEYDAWILNTTENWKKENPELEKEYYFERVIYWKLPNAHNVTIKRDRKWFTSIYPILETTWNKVLYYREHPDEIDTLYDFGEKRKKFYRLKTSFTLNNDYVDTKVLFLDDIVPEEDKGLNLDCDFIDDEPVITKSKKYKKLKKYKKTKKKLADECDFID